MAKRILFVAYIFPPTGGAGVQRAAKFVKYLPEFGWHPSVLTVENPSVPLVDDSLVGDIPKQTIIRRAPTWEPAYALKAAVAAEGAGRRAGTPGRLARKFARRIGRMVLQPDPQILWAPQAIRMGKRLLREHRHDAIFATGPPFSSFLVGAALSRTGIPLVLDYRDEWDLAKLYFENQRPDWWSGLVQNRMQRRVVRSAHTLLATTRSSAESLEKVRKAAGSRARVTWIYNGYDPADFPVRQGNGLAANSRYRLVYTGTLWTLTSAVPLVEAVRRLAGQRPDLLAKLELVFVGRRIGPQLDAVEALKRFPCRVVEYPYLPHDEALAVLHSADGLCLLLSDVPGAERVVPAKVFEYFAARRPILAIAPPGELWELLDGHSAAFRFAPSDVEAIADCLASQISGHSQGLPRPVSFRTHHSFDRRSQAGELASLLDTVIASPRRA
jgi:glycosyltransferase involved in cell wall biosynthesis